jgi:GNAT superfamily N-acetyltransferase
MHTGGDGTGAVGAVRVRSISIRDVELINQVIALGDQNSKTVGFMSPSAFLEHIARGTLLAAVEDDTVVGYALYRLSRNRVALAHLCVREDRRREGIARELVAHLSAKHADQLGILAKCRHSYGIDAMWVHLGFRQRSEMKGRSKQGFPLVAWWLDHGHTDLLSRPEPALLRAAVDLNIIRDFVDGSRTDAGASRALRADHIVDQLELVVTPALLLEIAGIEGDEMRKRCTITASEFVDVRADTGEADRCEQALVAAARRLAPAYPQTAQDKADVRHVAEAAAAGITVLVSRDENLRRLVGGAASEQYGLRILHPAHVLLHIDELTQAQVYRPAAVQGSEYRSQSVGAGQEDALLPFVNAPARERPNAFRQRLRRLAVEGNRWETIADPSGRLVALYVVNTTDTQVEAPILRVLDHRHADTIARQLLFSLRRLTVASGRSVLILTDPHPSRAMEYAAIADGFRRTEHGYSTLVLRLSGSADDVWQAASKAARPANLPEPVPLRSGMPAAAATEIERTWWPAKILDAQIQTCIVSIQPRWAAELLGVPETLTARAAELALSRDHVYYRSPRPGIVAVQSRILWYLSSEARASQHAPGIIGCSHVDDVVVDTPEALYERFRHLGVWQLAQIMEVARNGKAQAIRFSSTETFPCPVPRGRLEALGKAHDTAVIPYSPRRIPPELFAAIYQEGQEPS